MTDPKLVSHNLANPTAMPVPIDDVYRARCRPPLERSRIPQAGDEVLYRHVPHGDLTRAEVEHVDTSNLEDWNVYRVVLDGRGYPVAVNGRRVTEMVEDPWPDLILRTKHGRV